MGRGRLLTRRVPEDGRLIYQSKVIDNSKAFGHTVIIESERKGTPNGVQDLERRHS